VDDNALPDWIEIAKLVLAAPNAADGMDALLNRYDEDELPLEALMEALRALALPGASSSVARARAAANR
jgi:hypothetical protein